MSMAKNMKRPAPFSVGDVRCNPVRGPGADSPHWYWRATRPVGGGKRVTVWTGRLPRAEAITAVSEVVASGEASRPPPSDEVEITTFGHLLAYWAGAMAERGEAGDLAHNSVKHYRNAAKHLNRVVGHVHLDRFDATHLQVYRDRQLAGGRAPKTIGNDLGVAHAAWRWGQDRGLCDNRSLGRVRLNAKARVYNHYTPTRGELWRAVDALEERYGDSHPQYGQIIRFLAATGMRIGEACALTVADVHMGRRTARVAGGKTPRTVPLAAPALEVLVEAIGDRQDGKVWPGRPWTLQTATAQALRDLPWDELGLPRFTPHGIRRMVVVDLLSAGVDPAVEARIIGHSPEVAMRFYREVRREHMDEALAVAALGQREPSNVVPLRRRRGGEG